MQIHRLFEIVYILLDKKIVTAKELAEYFEVSARTIYRDVETLSAAGIPIYMNQGKGGGITLLPDFVLNKAMITEKEKEEILSSLNAIEAVTLEESNTALKKMQSFFGDKHSNWIEVDYGFWSDGEKEAELFQSIKEAILRKRILQFSYASGKGEETSRRVEPLKLVFKGTGWYLYGYCQSREAERFFKLKRIKELVLTEENFNRCCPKTVLKKQQKKQVCKTVRLKLRIEKEAAYRVYDDFEHCQKLQDGSFLIEGEFPWDEWLFYNILSYGEYCQVLEPPELRQQVKERLLRMLGRYHDLAN
ncbi:MAG: YafY family transcriptional regulator [Lachnospiraceae bacterium]|nr:YafY family transcriptional regulator [Lachnospiraceae bacterium]